MNATTASHTILVEKAIPSLSRAEIESHIKALEVQRGQIEKAISIVEATIEGDGEPQNQGDANVRFMTEGSAGYLKLLAAELLFQEFTLRSKIQHTEREVEIARDLHATPACRSWLLLEEADSKGLIVYDREDTESCVSWTATDKFKRIIGEEVMEAK